MSIGPEYIAGFFDGEGCISARIIHGRYGDYTRIQTTMNQKYSFILEEIRDYLKIGHLHRCNNKGRQWRYQINKREDVVKFLILIYPHLLGKKEQAELAIELNNKLLSHDRKTRMSKEERHERIELVKRISKLKKEEPCRIL